MSEITVDNAFPADLLFGAATAACQIEGAAREDGKGESIWDAFAGRPGRIRNADTPLLACDHYHRYAADVAIMRQLGLQAYRGSISWPRVLPEGRGRVNRAGLDFYSKLTDALLEAGIQPFYTLFHWDLPLVLQLDAGGFLQRDCADYFADYAALVVQALGDRVKNWITVNEPFEFSAFGHFFGSHAPGLKRPWAYFTVMHNLLLAHGKAVTAIRAASGDAKVGLALSYTGLVPETAAARDAGAALLADQFMNRITLDPVLHGEYPAELMNRIGRLAPKLQNGDMNCISAPLDFVGLNYYSREKARHAWWVPLLKFWVSGKDAGRPELDRPEAQTTAMGWEVYPQGLGDLARLLKDEYNNPDIYITENGAAFSDTVEEGPDGPAVHDRRRIQFLHDYLQSLQAAMAEGARVRGYFVWSLLDNFEWAEGYDRRFGLVRVDYQTQTRLVKDSGYWYARLIKDRRLPAVEEIK
ncbi:MAG: beta-glucosidase [Spirochaetes bacterium]|nr:beta-glucosidase [Spirochaetota bacterium]MBU0955755.1 beta-glucosidase [Spirochaetota bacterium]